MENLENKEKVEVVDGSAVAPEVAKVVEVPNTDQKPLLSKEEKQMLIDQIIHGKTSPVAKPTNQSNNLDKPQGKDVVTTPLVLSILSIIFVGLSFVGVPVIQWAGLVLGIIALCMVKSVPVGKTKTTIIVLSIVAIVLCALCVAAGALMILGSFFWFGI